MKNLRGNHTSLIDLAQDALQILKKHKEIEVSPGLIVRKNIKTKGNSITIQSDSGSLLLTFLMKSSKQFVRLYNVDTKTVQNTLKDFCETKQILLKVKES
jgi:hypothetical protein